MADSDNTRALPFVTQWGRRKSCAVDDGGAVGEIIHALRLRVPLDPCVVLLQEWEQAHHMVAVLCRLQQRLEIRIRNALASSKLGSGNVPQSSPQASVPTDAQVRWDELDRKVGYSRARAAEAQAVEAEEEILDAVATTPAQSLAGVIAKLKIIAGGGENMGDTSAFPWPQIQSVLADIQALGAEERPRPAEGRPDDNRPYGSRGLDDETNRLRSFLSEGDGAAPIESHPRRS